VQDAFIANLDDAFGVRSAKDLPAIKVDQKTIGYRGTNPETGVQYEDRVFLAQVFPSNGGILEETISVEGGFETKTHKGIEVHEMRHAGTRFTAFFEITEAYYNKTAKQKGVRLTLRDMVTHELGGSDNNNAQPNLFGYTHTKTIPAFDQANMGDSQATF